MRKTRLGGQAITLLIVINLVLWLVFPPTNDGRENFNSQYLAEMFSSSALLLMACGITLSLRPRFLEAFFGGLDKMYVMHKSVQLLAIIFLACHFTLVALTSSGFNWGPSLGKIALVGITTEIFLALVPRLPLFGRNVRIKYHHWKLLHRFTGLFFLVGILHTFRVEPVMNSTLPVYIYVRSLSFIGAGLYLYKELLEWYFKKGKAYQVSQVKKLNGMVAEVSLSPVADRLIHRAGQFLFIRFPGYKHLNEAHPFSISSAPAEDHLRLSIKNSGDFTGYLNHNLKEGAQARVEGGYGMFDYKNGSREQVWIAGGIGITPFLSWMRDFKGASGYQIDLFYSVRSAEEVLFEEELRAAESIQPGFKLHLYISNRDGRLSAEVIAASTGSVKSKDIYLCGPPPMIEALTEQLLELGVPRKAIHFEEFNFR